ncbi:universal stress protein [Flagellimonas allohymeniacidonis]|uniref:Universal stress protein n=1 Tax=Flagellimonas allohymeniacidonis TaxID=2517819 RepID=A0A4Q8QN64_9FLAO|nr:universal stress protein [Allomuricauda hymeniacidonis]TAI49746.1 universal stress protein [Allomuricauda hymeniacidonis]
MKNILLPTDFSDNSWNAIFFALKLFKDVSCNFYVVNTYDPDPKNVIGARTYVRTGMIIDALAESSQQGLEKMESYIQENHSNPNHSFEYASLKGELLDTLQDYRKQKDIDYIIMGTLGATGAKGVFMGTNSVRMVKSVRNCPIILVPNEFNLQKLERIIFPSDFSRFYDKYELMPLIELAKMCKASCQVLYLTQEFALTDEQKRNKKMLTERLAELDVTFNNVELKSKLAKGINEFAKEQRADLIAIVHYRHTFFEKLTREPVVKKVAFHSQIPLLILPELS